MIDMRIIIPCDDLAKADALCLAIRASCSTLKAMVTIDNSGHRNTQYFVTVETADK